MVATDEDRLESFKNPDAQTITKSLGWGTHMF